MSSDWEIPSNGSSGQDARISTMLYTQDVYQMEILRLVSVSAHAKHQW